MSILKVENIVKTYGKEKVLKNVSFTIDKPQIVALVGPNGSGKSTLLNIITNLLKPSSGEVSIFGERNKNPAIFKKISFMQDQTVLYDYLTGYDHLQFVADIHMLPKTRIIESARMIGIESYLNKKVKAYSLGMKQHLLLAMALINQPKLLILDEPLNGLDPTSAIQVRELLVDLYKSGTTILLSSHNLGEIDRVTSYVLFLKKGLLIEENLSIYEKTVYFFKLNNPKKAIQLLEKQNYNMRLEGNQLEIQLKQQSFAEVMDLLKTGDVRVLDIEKQSFGSENRYRQIFEEV